MGDPPTFILPSYPYRSGIVVVMAPIDIHLVASFAPQSPRSLSPFLPSLLLSLWVWCSATLLLASNTTCKSNQITACTAPLHHILNVYARYAEAWGSEQGVIANLSPWVGTNLGGSSTSATSDLFQRASPRAPSGAHSLPVLNLPLRIRIRCV